MLDIQLLSKTEPPTLLMRKQLLTTLPHQIKSSVSFCILEALKY